MLNPWENIQPNSERLIETNSNKYDFYWGVENNGDYAFYIPISSQENLPLTNISIKNLEIVVFDSPTPENYLWVIILKTKSQWSIFKKLCEDLCSVGETAINEKSLILQLQHRLKRWQELLSKKLDAFPLIKQMGLFSELQCLLNLIAPRIGVVTAISAWVGSDYDKQDFLLTTSALEVKSYRTSKGEVVTISSKEQLYTEKQSLYLATYALTRDDEKGENIQVLVDLIKEELNILNDWSALDLFENKLMDYGYEPLLIKENELFNFIIDKVHLYKIEQDFPRIIPSQITAEIKSLNYSLDLSTCHSFLIKKEDLILSNEGSESID